MFFLYYQFYFSFVLYKFDPKPNTLRGTKPLFIKYYTMQLKFIIIIPFYFALALSDPRIKVANISKMVQNFDEKGSLIIVFGEPFTGVIYEDGNQGRLKAELVVNQGVPNGSYLLYNDNGSISLKGTYQFGERSGVWEWYYLNGVIKHRGTFKSKFNDPYSLKQNINDNFSTNPYKKINKTGTLRGWYLDGLWEEYYESGELFIKGNYKNGEMNGVWEWYFKNKRLKEVGYYKDGKPNGEWVWYYESGKLWQKGSYKNGEKDGLWLFYYQNGVLAKTETYKAKNKLKRR